MKKARNAALWHCQIAELRKAPDPTRHVVYRVCHIKLTYVCVKAALIRIYAVNFISVVPYVWVNYQFRVIWHLRWGGGRPGWGSL